VLYQETFSDPDSGWEQTAKTVGSLDYFSGVYRIIVAEPDYDLWTTSGLRFTDVRVEVDAAHYSGTENNRFGLICRYQDAMNFYFFVISSDGYQAIGKTSQGETSLLSGAMMTRSEAIIVGIAPNHLRFDCAGSTLTGYVNGMLVASVQDSAFPDGDIGLLAGAFDATLVDIIFDNLIVTQP
jgi:hypothetical protein